MAGRDTGGISKASRMRQKKQVTKDKEGEKRFLD